jgi:G3E family GTPase
MPRLGQDDVCCNACCATRALSNTAVLINEFGEVGLDHYLLERIDERMVMLQELLTRRSA